MVEISIARYVPDVEKAAVTAAHLDGSAFQFFYEYIAAYGTLSEAAKNFRKVKYAFIEHLGVIKQPEDLVRQAASAEIVREDIVSSIKSIN